jgi:hypothetical protein
MGKKVPLERQRLRGKGGGEVRLGTYELFQQTRHLDDQVWWKMLRGLTMRNYPLVTRNFAEAYDLLNSDNVIVVPYCVVDAVVRVPREDGPPSRHPLERCVRATLVRHHDFKAVIFQGSLKSTKIPSRRMVK